MKTAADILMELVAIPSVSSMSNAPVVERALRDFDSGWKISRYPYRDPSGVDKLNAVAQTGDAPELALVCHTDTVPFETEWADAVHPVIRKGKLFGRGSCDVKAFLACILSAASRIDITRLAKPLAIVMTADEEIGCVGAKFLAARKAVRSRYTIVGEPTGLRPVRAGKGYALGEIVVRGKEAHSAFPERGRSAIFDAARVLAALERVARKLRSRKDSAFDPPYTTLNAGLIQGGTAKNIIPGECRITVEWRPLPGQDPEWASALIAEEIQRLTAKYPGMQAEFQVKRLDPAFHPASTSVLASMFERLSRKSSTTVSFGTEAPHLGGREETIVFGPGDMTVAHKSGEFVPLRELEACTGYLKTAIEKICGLTRSRK